VNRIIKDSGSSPRFHDEAHLSRPRINATAVRPFALKAGLVAFAVAAALVAALPAAHAQQAPAGSQAPASSQAPVAAQAPASAPASSTATPAPAASSSSSSADAGGQASANKSEPVCFKLTGHCVDASKGSTKSGTAKAKTGANGKKLNLIAPDVSTVVPEQELKEPLPNAEQVTEVQEAQTVAVKTEGVPTDVPQGLGAIWWAVVHPSQAWRIVTPYE